MTFSLNTKGLIEQFLVKKLDRNFSHSHSFQVNQQNLMNENGLPLSIT